MRPWILAETNWKEVKKEDYELAVLPWGATEAHNYHLPYGTDIYEADYIAAEAARIAWEDGCRPIVLPTIPFGVNTGQADIKLDINIYPSTQAIILQDVVEVLNRQNIKKLLVLNSHGGNNFRPMIREIGAKFPEMFISTCDWFRALDKSRFFEEAGDHADEMETSLMMYLRGELVLPLHEAGDGADKKSKIEGIRQGWAWAERQWSQVTADTGVGNPHKSSAEKGKAYFEAVTRKAGKLMADLCRADLQDLYE